VRHKQLFEIGQQVKDKDAGEIGRAKYRSLDRDIDCPYYSAEFESGTRRVFEGGLSPA
jgi:hypothetical protein